MRQFELTIERKIEYMGNAEFLQEKVRERTNPMVKLFPQDSELVFSFLINVMFIANSLLCFNFFILSLIRLIYSGNLSIAYYFMDFWLFFILISIKVYFYIFLNLFFRWLFWLLLLLFRNFRFFLFFYDHFVPRLTQNQVF